MSNTITHFLTKADMKRARKFAKDRLGDTDLYEKRGGFKEDDIISGAMGELAVYRELKDRGVDVSYPDFKIYSAGQKSYECDLTDGIHAFHVKSQTLSSKEKYGSSWLMQKSDKLTHSPERLNYIVPTTVCVDTGRVEIHGIFSAMSLVQSGCFSECVVPWFRKYKTALYLDHIEPIFTKKATWGFLEKFKERYERYE